MAAPLQDALDAAVARHFATLFEVLMVDPSEKGMQRFENGLKRLLDTEQAVAKLLGNQSSSSAPARLPRGCEGAGRRGPAGVAAGGHQCRLFGGGRLRSLQGQRRQ